MHLRQSLFYTIFFLFFVAAANTQTVGDALRFSDFQLRGTARFTATAGALTPFGADLSVLSTNPAGLGWYRNSEFVVTPQLDISRVDARLQDAIDNPTNTETESRFLVNNIGFLVAGRPRGGALRNINFGIGLNRLADFRETFFYQGVNFGSIVESFQEFANDGVSDPFGVDLAFATGAIFEENGVVFSDFDGEPEVLVERNQRVERDGGISEFSLGVAGNVRDKVLWGVSLGVPILSYEESRVINEFNAEPDFNLSPFDDLTYREDLNVGATGLNAKLGVIIRPTQPLRISFAVHTPTLYFQVQDTFETSLRYFFTENDEPLGGTELSPFGIFDYQLSTPWRFSGGLGYLFGRSGFLSAELEFVDFRNARFGYDAQDQAAEDAINEDIDNLLTSTLQLRLGGEFNLEPFRLRGGFQLRPSAVEGTDVTNTSYHAGIGFFRNGFFIDAAYVLQDRTREFSPYRTLFVPPQVIDLNELQHQVMVTVGFKFQ